LSALKRCSQDRGDRRARPSYGASLVRALGLAVVSLIACFLAGAQPARAAETQQPTDTAPVVIPHVFLYYQAS